MNVAKLRPEKKEPVCGDIATGRKQVDWYGLVMGFVAAVILLSASVVSLVEISKQW